MCHVAIRTATFTSSRARKPLTRLMRMRSRRPAKLHDTMSAAYKMFYFALLTFTTFATTCKYTFLTYPTSVGNFLPVATVDVVVVGDNNTLCVGMSVTLQCTLMGGVLAWETPDGAFNFIRGRQNTSYRNSYYGQLMEPNGTHLISTLNFTFTTEITINCSDTSSIAGTTVIVEGTLFLDTHIFTFQSK